MIEFARSVDRWWRAPAPAERLAGLRILVGLYAAGYALIRAPAMIAVGSLDPAGFRPTGVVSLLSAPLPPWIAAALAIATAALGLAFVAGWRFRASGPLFALGLAWVCTYRNSWGMIFHTENLMVLHVAVLGLSRSADAWSLDARRAPAPAGDGDHGWPLRLSATLTAITYVLAGLAKLRGSGLAWVSGDLVQNLVAFDNLRKAELGDAYAWLGAALVGHPWVFRPIAALSLAVELLAPVALCDRRFAAAWALAAWTFHLGVAAVMLVIFPYPLIGLAYAPFFAIERLPGLRRLGERLSRSPL